MKNKFEKIKAVLAFCIIIAVTIVFFVLNLLDKSTKADIDENADIILYGEAHGIELFYKLEFYEWKKFYDDGYRNLFVELPYYSAEYINIWMHEDSDETLDLLFEDIEGTMACNEFFYDFLHRIKKQCPETVFYGTDVGHQYNTTGARYLQYLVKNNLSGSDEFSLTSENIRQGMEFYSADTDNDGISDVREEYMVSNFVDAYNRAGGGKIMGIYGSYHTDINNPDVMGGKLASVYKNEIDSATLYALYFSEYEKPYDIGICVTGIVFMIMLFVPNIIWAYKAKPEGYKEASRNENNVLIVFERLGEACVCTSLLLFPSLNPKVLFVGGIFFEWKIFIWITAFVLMILYECYWIKYFTGPHTMERFYSSFAGFPLAGATLPVTAVLLLGIYSGNLLVIASSVVMGIGHIGIHAGHRKEIE